MKLDKPNLGRWTSQWIRERSTTRTPVSINNVDESKSTTLYSHSITSSDHLQSFTAIDSHEQQRKNVKSHFNLVMTVNDQPWLLHLCCVGSWDLPNLVAVTPYPAIKMSHLMFVQQCGLANNPLWIVENWQPRPLSGWFILPTVEQRW